MSLFEDTNPRVLKELLMISDRAPSDYLAEMRNTPGFPFETVLRSHSLPIGLDSPLLRDDYEVFLAWRQESLWQGICKVTGVAESTDLEAPEEV